MNAPSSWRSRALAPRRASSHRARRAALCASSRYSLFLVSLHGARHAPMTANIGIINAAVAAKQRHQ